MFDYYESEPPKIYWLDVRAGVSDIDRHEIHADKETARHEYESWKYDSRLMAVHGHVSLTEMTPDENGKFVESRNLGEHQW